MRGRIETTSIAGGFHFVEEKIGAGLITGHVFEGKTGADDATLLTDTEVIEGKLNYKDATGKYSPLIPFFEYPARDGEYSI